MLKLVITSQKGGVGKSTVAINLAYALSRRGWQTLLMDTDPQGAIGFSVTEKARTCRGFYDALKGVRPADEFVLSTRLPELMILPAGKAPTLFQTPTDLENSPSALDEIFRTLSARNFDIAVIDTVAGFGAHNGEILKRADYVIIPQQSEPLGARSLPQILQALADLKGQGAPLEVAGILLTMVDRASPESASVARELRAMLPDDLLFRASIPRNPIFLQASARGVPVALLRKNPPPAAILFDEIAAELESRINLQHSDTLSRNEFTRLMD